MIITLTLNPAMDRVLLLDHFQLNVTNRILRHFTCVGGKGTHVSINLSLLGVRSTAFGVTMGDTGREILESLRSMNIDVEFIHLPEGSSRTNYVLIDGENNCTLLSEKGQPVDDAVMRELLDNFRETASERDIVVISGDASNPRGVALLDTLIATAKERNAEVCLDVSGEYLATGIERRPFLIKPNLDELGTLFGRRFGSKAESVGALRELAAGGIRNIVVSCGGEGSLVYADGRFFDVHAPVVEVRNSVGCGDALLAGMLAGFEEGLEITANLKRATAVAAAAAMNESTVGFDTSAVSALERQVLIEERRFTAEMHS